jgi:opacity protein-like surface antigen
MRKTLLCAACALLLMPFAVRADEWTSVELRGWVDLIEITMPLFNEAGGVDAGAVLGFGLGWRQIDTDEKIGDPEADGLKPVGVFLGASFDVRDSFNFKWVQLSAGVSYEDHVGAGLGLWMGNATEMQTSETGETVSVVVPGLDLALKGLVGLGVSGDPK